MITETSTTTSFEDFSALFRTHRIIPVTRVLFADSDTPVNIYRKLANGKPGTFLLESAQQGGVWTRFSFVGCGSFGVLSERNERAHWQAFGLAEEDLLPGGVSNLAPLDAVDAVYRHWASADVPGLPPLTGGLVGFLGWETIRQLEHLPHKPLQDVSLPTQSLSFVSELVVIDHKAGALIVIANVVNNSSSSIEELWESGQQRLDRLQHKLTTPAPVPLALVPSADGPSATPQTPAGEYLSSVARAQQYITDGDVFQVVLSQRFDLECSADPLDVYRMLRHLNPSPYLYLLSFEDEQSGSFSIVGSSPEALVTVKNRHVLTHPIAGSRPRGATPEEDHALEVSLLADTKERAEHLMLVDLSRNDLLKVCLPESLEVSEFMKIERFSHIMHIVSSVEGQLRPGSSPVDVIRATFPAGTLSGAPKPRALEIIDELETHQRGVYGGVIGYISVNGDVDMAIAIRTATLAGGKAYVQAGAGIVADSVPEAEHEECKSKAAAPLRAVALANALTAVTST